MLKQEKISKEYLKEILPENPIVIEAGAHIGRDSLKMSKLWPNGKIYSFEPVPELFEELKKRAQKTDNIFCYNLALGKKTESRNFFVSSGRSTAVSSFFEPGDILKEENIFTPIQVQVVNLDEWAKNNNINMIDFMWLDMQGAELEVLESSPKIRNTVKYILVEINLSYKYKDIILYNEMLEKITRMGFEAVIQDLPKHEKVNILFKKIRVI